MQSRGSGGRTLEIAGMQSRGSQGLQIGTSVGAVAGASKINFVT